MEPSDYFFVGHERLPNFMLLIYTVFTGYIFKNFQGVGGGILPSLSCHSCSSETLNLRSGSSKFGCTGSRQSLLYSLQQCGGQGYCSVQADFALLHSCLGCLPYKRTYRHRRKSSWRTCRFTNGGGAIKKNLFSGFWVLGYRIIYPLRGYIHARALSNTWDYIMAQHERWEALRNSRYDMIVSHQGDYAITEIQEEKLIRLQDAAVEWGGAMK